MTQFNVFIKRVRTSERYNARFAVLNFHVRKKYCSTGAYVLLYKSYSLGFFAFTREPSDPITCMLMYTDDYIDDILRPKVYREVQRKNDRTYVVEKCQLTVMVYLSKDVWTRYGTDLFVYYDAENLLAFGFPVNADRRLFDCVRDAILSALERYDTVVRGFSEEDIARMFLSVRD